MLVESHTLEMPQSISIIRLIEMLTTVFAVSVCVWGCTFDMRNHFSNCSFIVIRNAIIGMSNAISTRTQRSIPRKKTKIGIICRHENLSCHFRNFYAIPNLFFSRHLFLRLLIFLFSHSFFALFYFSSLKM